MTIDFKQPKYILPLLALPFLALFFYVYQSSSKPKTEIKKQAGINSALGEVSDDVKKKTLTDKLDAYRNTYKQADGNTAVSPFPIDKAAAPEIANNYSGRQKQMLDSINRAMKQKFSGTARNSPTNDNQAMIAALNHVRQKQPEERRAEQVAKEKDPMELFRQQMSMMDSLQKVNDPEAKAEAKKQAVAAKLAQQKSNEHPLAVSTPNDAAPNFNTIKPVKDQDLIQVVIDENITGYAGSRIRLRLLQDIDAGGTTITKGSYLYALINGFSGQRVTLEVRSIFFQGKILPVKLDLYDTDGLPGLYVPESAFRDFTKDLGTNTIQGVTMDGSSSFVMSSIGKIFESTSSAIAGMIRKNKAKLKYNSYIYLIDNSKQ
ncbi:MAG: conjugative transposon protein TraM [Bacteroidota bacterium]